MFKKLNRGLQNSNKIKKEKYRLRAAETIHVKKNDLLSPGRMPKTEEETETNK